ncbi:MAG: FAD-binding oxidoreductase [Solirubrobacteraceae bacterium]
MRLASELRISGDIVRPNDPGYEQARRVWNGLIDRRPAIIARCKTAADVQAALAYAKENGLTVAVRGGGHNVAGFGTCDGGVVIDLSPMKTVDVDPDKKIARAGGGVLWREFDAATQAHGLASTGGLVSTTGVAGFTLGGGIGWLMRAYGLACDNLIGAEVVTADGRVVHASETEHADLLCTQARHRDRQGALGRFQATDGRRQAHTSAVGGPRCAVTALALC